MGKILNKDIGRFILVTLSANLFQIATLICVMFIQLMVWLNTGILFSQHTGTKGFNKYNNNSYFLWIRSNILWDSVVLLLVLFIQRNYTMVLLQSDFFNIAVNIIPKDISTSIDKSISNDNLRYETNI